MISLVLGVADGTRTHDDQNHNLGLYQLSYSHRCVADYNERVVATPVQLAAADAAAAAAATTASSILTL